MIYTTDDRQNNIKYGEEKDTEKTCSSAFDQTGNPNEGNGEGSDRENAVKNDIHDIRADQRNHKKQVTKSNQQAKGQRSPDQGYIYR